VYNSEDKYKSVKRKTLGRTNELRIRNLP